MAKDQQPAPKRLLRTNEAATYLSVGRKKLRRLIRAGEIPVIGQGDEGSPWLIDRVDLDHWIEKNKVKLN